MDITKETIIGDMLAEDSGIAYVLMNCGMHCVTCPAALGESLEEACLVHGLDPDDMVNILNEYLIDKAQVEQENVDK
ncbi:MAG: DUF1858 domain-containing protein [Candidatus Fimenecus sp.]